MLKDTHSDAGTAERIAALKESCAGKPHGTRARYKTGCRCMVCRAANSRYNCARERARRDGDRRDLVPVTRVLRHLRVLSRRGVGYKAVADAAGISRSTLGAILMGRRTRIRMHRERAILAVDAGARSGGSLVCAQRTWRRIEKLLEAGYSKAQIARWCGWKYSIQLSHDVITARNAMRVERVANLIEAGRLRRDR
jgi:hypothetical protein